MSEQHIPVMLHEAIAGLQIKPDGSYIDATFGRGGHSQAILGALGQAGRLLVLDQDPQAIATAELDFAHDPRVCIAHAAFADVAQVCEQQAWPRPLNEGGAKAAVDGVLMDLGVSSPQLDNAARGFSFSQDGPLDMRMNPQAGESVEAYLQHVSAAELADVLYHYGEERHSRRIARAIVAAVQLEPITSTAQLAAIIKQAHPAWPRKQHPATRSFQALRIKVNAELEQLQQALIAIVKLLAPAGRLAVISFHSLEDRIVKQFIRQQTGAALASGLPDPAAPMLPQLKPCGGLQRPSALEIERNPRARSSRLRVAEKLV